MEENVKKFFRDIIPVLAGVLIALFINTWNEGRKDQVYIENFYASLKKELLETDEEIKQKMPKQKALIDTLAIYSNNETLSLMEVIAKGGGASGPTIKLNYWKALSRSKIELLEYEQLSALASIDEGNEFLKFKREKLMDFIYSNLTETGKKEKFLLRLILEDYLRTQTSIQNEIQKVINE